MTPFRIAACVALVALAIWIGSRFFTAPSNDGAPPAELAASERGAALELEPLVASSSAVHREAAAATAPPAALPDDVRIRVIDGSTGARTNAFEVWVSWVVERPDSRSSRLVCKGRPAGTECELQVPRAAIEEQVKEARANGRLQAYVIASTEKPLAAYASIDPWPEEPLELVVPPLGWIRLRVEDDTGRALARDGKAQVARQYSATESNVHRLPIAKGESESITCEVGVELSVSAELADGTRIESFQARGPERAGETKWIGLRLAPPLAVLRMRLLIDESEPLRMQNVAVSIEQRRTAAKGAISSGSSQSHATDAEGWLVLAIEENMGGQGFRRTLEISHERARRGRLTAFVDISRAFPSGTMSLGDILLREPPLLVSGIVVDGAGTGVAGAAVICEILDHDMRGGIVMTDSYGRFERRSAVPATRVRVDASADGYAAAQPQEVPAGTSELVLALAASASLRGSILVPEGMDPTYVSVRVIQEGVPPVRRPPRNRLVKDDGTFFVRDLAPGPGHVQFSHRAIGLVETIRDVAFSSGEESREPRLQNVVLCSGWRRLALRLVDAAGAPKSVAKLVLHARTAAPRSLHSDEQGRCETWIAPAEHAFMLHVPGHRSVELIWTPDEQEVRLLQGFRVTLPVEAKLFAPITRIRVALKHESGISSEPVYVVDGLAVLEIADPGRYKLEPALVIEQGGQTLIAPLEIDPPYVVDVAEDDERRLPSWKVTEAMLRAALEGH